MAQSIQVIVEKMQSKDKVPPLRMKSSACHSKLVWRELQFCLPCDMSMPIMQTMNSLA